MISRGSVPGATGTDANAWYWSDGFSGITSDLLLNRVNGVSGDDFNVYKDANIVLLHIGTNDYHTLTPDQTTANIVAIINAFFARRPATGVPLYFFVMGTINAGSDPINDALNAFITAVRPKIQTAVSGMANVYYVNPPIPNIPDGDFLSGSQGIHPLDSGYALMVDDGNGNGWKPAMIAAGL